MSVGWSLFFIYLLYFTAPAYAAFARWEILQNLVGQPIAALPDWVANWGRTGLLTIRDANSDGILQFAELSIVAGPDRAVDARDRGLAVHGLGAGRGGRPGRGALDGRRPADGDRDGRLPRHLRQADQPERVVRHAGS